MVATNITELIWSKELCGILRLCGADEREIGQASSDYQKFRALCNALPLLEGHSLPPTIGALLQTRFHIHLPISNQTCEKIWQMSAEQLRQTPVSITCMLHLSDRQYLLKPPKQRFCGEIEVLHGNKLCQTVADSWQAWQCEILQALDRAVQNNCNHVILRLSGAACRQTVSRYHVDLALQTKSNVALLEAQLFRMFAIECQNRNMTLILYNEGNGEETADFLARTEKKVGLPNLIWLATEPDARRSLIAFNAQYHKNTVRFAIEPNITDYSEIAAVYPLGRLLLLSDPKRSINRKSVSAFFLRFSPENP